MRVVHLYDGHEKVYDGRGSVPNVVWHLARETAAAGHEVTVLERRWAGLPAAEEREGVAFHRFDLATGADEPWTRVPYEMVTSPVGLARLVGDRTNFALEALRHLRSLDFDLLHVHLPFAASVLATVAPWLRDRMVYTAHLGELRLDALSDDQKGGDGGRGDADGGDGESADGGLAVPEIVKRLSPDVYLANRAEKTAVLNPEIREVFADRGVPDSKLSVVPNGVDLNRFGDPDHEVVTEVEAKYDLGDRPTLLFVGTVMPRKGVVDLVRAVEQVAASGHDPRLVVAGENDLDPAYTDRVRSLIREAGLEEHVELTGFVPSEELPALYALADVFVAPSLEEGFGMTVAEAMAAGTPVVGTRVGRVPWLLDDERCGRVVEPGDADAFASAVSELLDDPAERDRMAERARERARDVSWEGVTEDVRSIYQEVTE
ncbi:glycosyltransferase family 4 protein [Halorussus caseinilyticus]|uniref:Glycosyltransferase family 4 protein n=1 Tax=Halorussus caseinilyticus TaxID=3034025 RepID=A0ABD5WNV1_9EURY|nr:glycosyltransferase family 4 protein [Halorussus sp. DT72]